MRYRFYGDGAQADFVIQLSAAGASFFEDGHVVEALGPGAWDPVAFALGATPDDADEKPNSSTGVEAHNDLAAFSVRSNAAEMRGYEPPAVVTVIPKTLFPKTPRRATLGQPL